MATFSLKILVIFDLGTWPSIVSKNNQFVFGAFRQSDDKLETQ